MMRVLNGMFRVISSHCVLIASVFFLGCSDATVLKKTSSEDTGIFFENTITENDLNILDYLYFYNGAGVAAGDFNNDGLQDLFFVSNQHENRIYINRGDLKFIDITSSSGIKPVSNWNTGVSLVDINNDGWLDIYINAVVGINGFYGHNELWVNQKNGTFLEQSKDYGLDLSYYGVSTAFFDYDKDGDLDAYVVNHGLHPDRNFEYQKEGRISELMPMHDRLLRNDDGFFRDVTKNSGLVFDNIGYGLAVSIQDFDQDGWDDIYVSNDFYENDYFYVNQADGTFKESLSLFFTQTSQFSMGVDSKDLNNDSYPEILTLDMLPEDETALKSSIDDNTSQSIRRRRSLGYIDQFPRNHLQLNFNGRAFRDVASVAGIEATDWSWSGMFGDINNDGVNDLYISNGILRRPNDGDFIKYISSSQVNTTLNNTKILDETAIGMMPEGLISDKIYQGVDENLRFIESSKEWVLDGLPNSSNAGLLLVDLDNDGDLEIVLNGTNEPASILLNRTSEISDFNYSKIRLEGYPKNSFGVGAKIYAFSKGKTFYEQLSTTRGFLSSQAPEIHLGLGEMTIDSAYVIWPNQIKQNFKPKINDTVIIHYQESEEKFKPIQNAGIGSYTVDNLDFITFSNDYPEFDRERLLPLGITATNPVVATSDLNSDGIEDFYLGGSKGYPGSLWLSSQNSWNKIEIESFVFDRKYEDSDAVFFDINQDGYLDLFVASGGGEYREGSDLLEDRVYINNHNYSFDRGYLAKPQTSKNSSTVVVSDFDSNGFKDVFVGTRSVPGDYTKMASSHLYFNFDGKLSEVRELSLDVKLGKVTGASDLDLNRDGNMDLVIALEWERVVFLENDGLGNFTEVTPSSVSDVTGIWQSLEVHDYDHDGDLDLLLGNVGLNTRFETEPDHPMSLCFGDFNLDGVNESLVSIYKEDAYYPLESIDILKSQINELRKIYPSYSSFSGTNTSELIEALNSENIDCLEVSELRSGVFLNEDGFYVFSPFSDEFQNGPGSVIHQLKNGHGFIFGGVKTDVAAVQGAWRSQPFIIFTNQRDDIISINPELFRDNTTLVPLNSSNDKHFLLATSLNSEVRIITLTLPIDD